MTEEERQAFMELSTYLADIVINDPVVDPELASEIVARAKILQDCKALDSDIREKYRKVTEIFTKLSEN